MNADTVRARSDRERDQNSGHGSTPGYGPISIRCHSPVVGARGRRKATAIRCPSAERHDPQSHEGIKRRQRQAFWQARRPVSGSGHLSAGPGSIHAVQTRRKKSPETRERPDEVAGGAGSIDPARAASCTATRSSIARNLERISGDAPRAGLAPDIPDRR